MVLPGVEGAGGVAGDADCRGLAGDGAAGPPGDDGRSGCGAVALADDVRSTLSGAGWTVTAGGDPGPPSRFSVDCARAGALPNSATATAAKMIDIAQPVRLNIREAPNRRANLPAALAPDQPGLESRTEGREGLAKRQQSGAPDGRGARHIRSAIVATFEHSAGSGGLRAI